MDTMHAAVQDADTRQTPRPGLFDRHNQMLEEHRRFLEQFRQERKSATGVEEGISLAIQQTEWMFKCFADCKSAYESINNAATGSSPIRTQIPLSAGSPTLPATYGSPPETGPELATLHREPYQKMDDSGLFMFDTIPTDPNGYLNETRSEMPQSRQKRRWSNDMAIDDGGHPRQKKARNNGHNVHPGGTTYASRSHFSVPYSARGAAPEPQDSGEEDSFVREVKELQKEKEAKWRKREEKKRKRESNGSDRNAPPSGQMEGMSIRHGHEPARKRRRTSQNNTSVQPNPQAHGTPKNKRLRSTSRRGDKKAKRQRR
ncbi:uncharacterized protein AB675_4288 [Cyphellophora attinorum]|uniref:Uncharacterized protein n=1 Tax=Cyphellophora attinorum TaxID=1664694 RepID=A0A0N1H711_9EURO|nr:uncharacterized protein AB675_4288 [Phialophora attinorum]KPI38637.1 hypothetical protein AB675_4288 [Phialophora attinorum]